MASSKLCGIQTWMSPKRRKIWFRSFETALRRRQRGHVIRLIVHKKLSDSMIDFLCEQFKIKDREWVMPVGGLIDLTDVSELCKLDRPELLFGAFRARFPERIRHFDGDCFAAIANKDFVVHHPFESFDVVVSFCSRPPRILRFWPSNKHCTARAMTVRSFLHCVMQQKQAKA